MPAEGNGIFKLCIHCGQRINTKEDITIQPLDKALEKYFITEAGSYVDSDGIIYLVESDMALYLAGELDVYALAQNVGDLVTQ